MNPYMYMFVREDLSVPQQIVQTAHAVDELNKVYPHAPGNYMALCGVKSEDQLLKVSKYLSEHGVLHEMFFEPDIDSYTAIATKPLVGDERTPLRKFALLK
jgi:hypothetical protein